ncbi:MAG: response regulator [Vicinamibacteria bacterium]
MPGPILVVDDDEDLQQLLRLVLEGRGYSVETASNGEEALACIERQRPGVVLLDMRMPVMNGWEFAAALRERGLRQAPPIVVVTAAANPGQQAAEVGAAGWIAKPFDMRRVMEAVEQALATG